MGMRLIASMIIGLSLSAQAYAQAPDPETLDSLTKAEELARQEEAQLAQKRKLVTAEITDLKSTLAKSAKQTRAFELEKTQLLDRMGELTSENSELEAELSANRQSMMELLAALQRLEASPPPAMVSRPEDAVRAAQAAQLMASLRESLQKKADELSESLINVSEARAEIAEQQRALDANHTKLEKRRSQTQKLVEQKAKLQKSIETDEAKAREEVARLAAESKNLRDLIASLEAEVAKIGPRVKPDKNGAAPNKPRLAKPVTLPKGTRKFAEAKGTMVRPITGRLLRNYGKGEKGLTYAGQSNGQVLAPYAGRVEFSGPFKNYDQVVILNVGDNYFILLTGLGDIFVKTGDTVHIGEPIGTMPFKAKGTPSLYIELRRNGQTINPVPWLEPRPVKNG